MDNFLYKKRIGVTALLAQMSEFKYKKHAHKEYALGVTLDGIQHYTLDGDQYLSYPNNVMFFNPEQIHDGSSFDKKDLKYTMIYLEREHILGNDNIPQNVIFNKPISNDQNLKNKIIHLSNAILTNQEDAYVLEQLLQVNDALLNNDINVAPKDNRLINMAKNIIESHLFDTLNVEMISLELNMTQYQFIRYFKKYTGFTPYQYYLNRKVEQAKLNLEITKDIYAAITNCGFVDLSHLNKNFKKIYGITAFEYLNQLI